MFVPDLLYHGSRTANIKALEPRGFSKPTAGRNIPAVYASSIPAVGVAHGVGWTSEEGIDFYVRTTGIVCLIVPKMLAPRLYGQLSLYTISSKGFEPTPTDYSGTGWFSLTPTLVLEEKVFGSALDAISEYNMDLRFF